MFAHVMGFFCACFLQTSIAALNENSPPFEIGLKGEVKTSDSSGPLLHNDTSAARRIPVIVTLISS